MASTQKPVCTRCNGWTYPDDPTNKKTDWSCLMCGESIYPPNFKPLPYVARFEDTPADSDWYIDEHGDIIDIIDRKIEEYIAENDMFTVSSVSKKVQCSNSEARMTLERLVRNGRLREYTYGPMDRWTGYTKEI